MGTLLFLPVEKFQPNSFKVYSALMFAVQEFARVCEGIHVMPAVNQ